MCATANTRNFKTKTAAVVVITRGGGSFCDIARIHQNSFQVRTCARQEHGANKKSGYTIDSSYSA